MFLKLLLTQLSPLTLLPFTLCFSLLRSGAYFKFSLRCTYSTEDCSGKFQSLFSPQRSCFNCSLHFLNDGKSCWHQLLILWYPRKEKNIHALYWFLPTPSFVLDYKMTLPAFSVECNPFVHL